MGQLDNYKFRAVKQAYIAKVARAIMRGAQRIFSSRKKTIVIVIMFTLFFSQLTKKVINMTGGIVGNWFFYLADFSAAIMIALTIMYFYGRPFKFIRYESAFVRIGLTDSLGLPPEIIDIKDNGKGFIVNMKNCGKALSEWQDRRIEIETTLGIVISGIKLERGNTELTLSCVPADRAFSGDYIIDMDRSRGLEITIGYRADGIETIDFNRTAHVLIGGATGSGKTVLLRSILVSLIHRGCQVYLCDFKGGIDFPEPIWDEAKVITDYDGLIESLEKVIYELEDRKRLFLLYGAKNIEEYNSIRETGSIKHIVIGTDEVAEMLDRTGRKDDKAKIDKVIEMLSTIARLGRAYGIHLILSTQRPDATVIPGQIKNNLTYRACGHADKTLSQIVIDTTSAAEIPADVPGWFLSDKGEEFKALMLSDAYFQ